MKNLILIIFIFSPLLLQAQSVSEIKQDKDHYIWGEGKGNTLKEADNAALTDLISQISTQVESDFKKIVEQSTSESNTKFKETVNDVVRTYSSATLKNTDRLILQDEPDAFVFRYVKRSEISRIFESRKNKIIELARNGEEALKDLQIADALRYFYWSQTLLRSHPESSEIKMKDEDGQERLLITWLPMKINEILANVSFKVEGVDQMDSYSNYLIKICYKNEPVRNLDYTYWGGHDWSNVISAKDGSGIVEMPKTITTPDIRFKVEYAFEGEANIDMELRDVMQKLPQVPYKSSYQNVSVRSSTAAAINAGPSTTLPAVVESVPAAQSSASVMSSTINTSTISNSVGNLQTLSNVSAQEAVMKQIIHAIGSHNYASVENLFTPEGVSIYKKLLQYGNARIIHTPILKYFQYNEYVICRFIPMSFNFKTNNRTFIEDVVFYLNKDNKVCNIAFGLEKKALHNIASKDAWSEADREMIISFLENYKTAYALKRFDYINDIFSDNALIITGIVTKVNRTAESPYLSNTIVKYNRQTKAEYMRKLKYSFDSNEFINIRFADNTVRRSFKGNNLYGIQIKQDYFSTHYGDSGYLFLLVDLSDKSKPQIHVRTWQPEKNPDGSIYGVGDF